MSRFKLTSVTFLTVLTILIGGMSVSAQTANNLSGGNLASDYQPPTNNPQANTATGLQNTSSGLQPVSGQSVISQQNLGAVKNLQVADSGNSQNLVSAKAN